MTQLSHADALKLLEDRIEFKFYSAEQELNRLKKYENNEERMSSTPVTRVMWEMKIECLLAQLVGSVDALLVRINDKLGLGMNIIHVDSSPRRLKEIKERLGTKANLLSPLEKALDRGDNTKNPRIPPGWLWTLKELRNEGMHRKIINVHTEADFVHDGINPRSPFDIKNVYLITDPPTSLGVIPYLEDS
jgi:hypothetical protein